MYSSHLCLIAGTWWIIHKFWKQLNMHCLGRPQTIKQAFIIKYTYVYVLQTVFLWISYDMFYSLIHIWMVNKKFTFFPEKNNWYWNNTNRKHQYNSWGCLHALSKWLQASLIIWFNSPRSLKMHSNRWVIILVIFKWQFHSGFRWNHKSIESNSDIPSQ